MVARQCAVGWVLWGARVKALDQGLRAGDRHPVLPPLFHTDAQADAVLACLWVGATAVVVLRFSASRFWPVSLAQRCTWTSLVPFCVKALMFRDDDRADSDVDLPVTLAAGTSALALDGLRVDAEELLSRRADVATEASLHPALRENVLANAVPL